MKNTKKFAAMIAALALSACSVAPMFSFAALTTDNLSSAGKIAYEAWAGEDVNKTVDGFLAIEGNDQYLITPSLTMNVPADKLPAGATIVNNEVKAYEVLKISKVANTAGQYNVTGWGDGVDGSKIVAEITADGVTDFNIQVPNTNKAEESDPDTVPENAFKDITYNSEKPADSAKAVGAALSKLTTDAQKEAFAKVVMNCLGSSVTATGKYADNAVSFATWAGEPATAQANTGLGNGYYIMTCEVEAADDDANASTTNKNKSTSLGMLTVVDGAVADGLVGKEGNAKIGLPQVMKKVKEDNNTVTNYPTKDAENNPITLSPLEAKVNADNEKIDDGDWNDVADYDIGDTVPFQLYGTMPDNYGEYKTYYYKFTDTLGLEFDYDLTTTNADTSVTENYTIVAINNGAETDITDKFTAAKNTFVTTANEFSFTCDNLKTIKKTVPCEVGDDGYNVNPEQNGTKQVDLIDKDTIIIVRYTAKLNASAVVGKPGQINKVYLEYSSNPNKEDGGEKGKTPEDKVKVHTYAVKLNKKFYNAAGEELTPEEVTEGVYSTAEFSLKKNNDDGTKTTLYFLPSTEDNKFDYVLAKQGDTVTVTETVDDVTAEVVKTAATTMTLEEVGEDLVIRVKGLDEGTYTLSETVVPTGYNKAPDQTITITAATENDQTWDGTETDETLKSFSWAIGDKTVYQGEDADGNEITADTTSEDGKTVKQKDVTAIADAKMENRKGTSLPSTGGIGTTIFYLGGGAMVAVAGVFLITKKRMGKQEN